MISLKENVFMAEHEVYWTHVVPYNDIHRGLGKSPKKPSVNKILEKHQWYSNLRLIWKWLYGMWPQGKLFEYCNYL